MANAIYVSQQDFNIYDNGIDLDNFCLQKELAKFEGLHCPKKYALVVRLYQSPKIRNGIHIPDTTHENEQYKNCVGLVIHVGEAAYKDEKYRGTGPWCKVGDWIIFPRHSGDKTLWTNIPVFFIYEDALWTTCDDPRKVTR